MFLLFDNVLNAEECSALIDLYEQNKHNSHKWRDTYPINLRHLEVPLVSSCCAKVVNVCKTIDQNACIEWGEIVRWDVGANQPLHTDTASISTVLTSITYLNDNYSGGNTYFFDGQAIQPRVGRTLIFDGKTHLHGVTSVENTYRYTLPIWYRKT